MPQVLMDKCTVMPMSVGPDADGVSMLPLATLPTKANKVGQTAAMLQPYGRCLAPIDAAGHIATSSHGRMHRIANTMRLSALDSESFRRTHFALSLQEWHAPHSSTASNLCTCTAEWECESPRARSFDIAKVRFRPEPGSRRRTATKPVQDEPIWEGSKLFKTLYNCFTIENDSAMPRFGRGVYALW